MIKYDLLHLIDYYGESNKNILIVASFIMFLDSLELTKWIVVEVQILIRVLKTNKLKLRFFFKYDYKKNINVYNDNIIYEGILII